MWREGGKSCLFVTAILNAGNRKSIKVFKTFLKSPSCFFETRSKVLLSKESSFQYLVINSSLGRMARSFQCLFLNVCLGESQAGVCVRV